MRNFGTGGATLIKPGRPTVWAKLEAVKEFQPHVAIISLGAEDGVKPGHRYTVSRGSTYVGTLEITDVQAPQSAARSTKNLEKSNLKRGDRVKSR